MIIMMIPFVLNNDDNDDNNDNDGLLIIFTNILYRMNRTMNISLIIH